MSDKVRLQFEVSTEQMKRLEDLMTICHIDTKKDLLNNALTLLQWAIDEKKEGYDIASMSKSSRKYRELRMPIFDHVRP